jgi:hypothetical protein
VIDKGLPARYVQDLGHRSGRIGMRDLVESGHESVLPSPDDGCDQDGDQPYVVTLSSGLQGHHCHRHGHHRRELSS